MDNNHKLKELSCATATAFIKFTVSIFELACIYHMIAVCGYGFWKMMFWLLIIDFGMQFASNFVLYSVYNAYGLSKKSIAKIIFEYQYKFGKIPDSEK